MKNIRKVIYVFIVVVVIAFGVADVYVRCIPLPQDVGFDSTYVGAAGAATFAYKFDGNNRIMCCQGHIAVDDKSGQLIIQEPPQKEFGIADKKDYPVKKQFLSVLQKLELLRVIDEAKAVITSGAVQKDFLKSDIMHNIHDMDKYALNFHIADEKIYITLYIPNNKECAEYFSDGNENLIKLAIKLVLYGKHPHKEFGAAFSEWVKRNDGNVVRKLPLGTP